MTKITPNKEINNLTTSVAVILSEMKTVKDDVKEIKDKLEKDYATKEWCESHYGEPTKQFKAIISLIVSVVTVAVIGLVIKK